ncbi:hypothetical protein HPP92_019982 [Vanilla planifolia]|uniref:Cyclin-like domain-containing protein n=1 Tax=Vanilla planifolia TaxID=51239 RepID=A0A835ULG2_VANPL|nr:hypothetical protein HPP92_019982 [Vanilla planifolia]
MEISDCSLSRLFCSEDSSSLAAHEEGDEGEECFVLWNASSTLYKTENEYLEFLVSKETSLTTATHSISPSPDEPAVSRDSPRSVRSESVHWILKMKSWFGFSSQTAFLAVAYFDRFFLQRRIIEEKSWATKLLSIACLSLAAKMEEYSPPLLSDYIFGDYRFSCKVIQRMELLVLDALEWRLCSITPFAYLGSFAKKFNFGHSSKSLFSRAIWCIFVSLEVIHLTDYPSSALAAAAILAASDDGLTKKILQSKISTISLSEPLEIEHVFSCYNAMTHKSSKEKTKSGKVLFAVDLPANYADAEKSNDVKNTSSFSPIGDKRRRLQ